MKSSTLYGSVIALAAAAGSLTALSTAGAQPHGAPHTAVHTLDATTTPVEAPPPAPAETPVRAPEPAPEPASASEPAPPVVAAAARPPPPLRARPTVPVARPARPRVATPALRVRTASPAVAAVPRVRSSSRALLYARSRASSRTPAPELLAPPEPPPVAPPAAPVVAQAAPTPPPPPPPTRASPPPAAPLQRSSHALELAPAPTGTGANAAFLVVFAGAAVGLGYWLRRNRALVPSGGSSLKILQRAPIGLRSELLVVDVNGQRHLLGVTPSSVQHLATLDEPEVRASHAPEPAAAPIGSRFDAMLDATREPAPREPERRARDARPRRPSIARREVEEQARGLLDLEN